MKKNETKNHSSKMVRKTKDLISIIFLSLVSLLSLSICIGLLLDNAALRRQADASQSELYAIESNGYYTTAQAEQLVENAQTQAKEEAYDELRKVFKDLLNNKGSLTAIRQLFPEDLIIASEGEYHFYPIDKTIQMNHFEEGDFKEEENGMLSYTGPDSNLSIRDGVDISRYQGDVDFNKVQESGIDFVMLRAGLRGSAEGQILKDDYFEQNLKAASKAGLDIGVYFDSSAVNEDEAIEEADFMIDLIKNYEITYPIALKLVSSESEDARTVSLSREEYSKIARAFCKEVESKGYTSMIFGNLTSFTELLEKDILENYNIWIVFTGERQYYPYKFRMWEYTKIGSVDGINGGANLIMDISEENPAENEYEAAGQSDEQP